MSEKDKRKVHLKIDKWISSCSECVYPDPVVPACSHPDAPPDAEIDDYDTIPDWCPLLKK